MPDTIAPPSPAPTTIQTPSPSSPPPAPPQKPPDKTTTAAPISDAEAESAFDKLEAHYTPKAPKEPAEKKPDVAGDDKKVVAQAQAKSDEKKPSGERRAGEKALEAQLAKVNQEKEELSKSIPELKAKIAEYESKGKDSTALIEQLNSEKKEKESLHAQIRMLKKEVSPDFKEKWDKPFERMVGRAMNDMKNMIVLGEKDPETGEQRTADRPAVWEDFQAIYAMPPNKAIAASRKLFGPEASTIVENYLIKLRDLDFDRSNALDEEKARWKENESREVAEQAQRKEQFEKRTAQIRQELINAHPDLYDEDPNDPEGNELLKLGRQYMSHQPKTMEEAVKGYERNKLNAEAAPRLAHRLEKANARIAELEAQISEFKESGPGTTRRTTQSTGKGEEKSLEEELRAIQA